MASESSTQQIHSNDDASGKNTPVQKIHTSDVSRSPQAKIKSSSEILNNIGKKMRRPNSPEAAGLVYSLILSFPLNTLNIRFLV